MDRNQLNCPTGASCGEHGSDSNTNSNSSANLNGSNSGGAIGGNNDPAPASPSLLKATVIGGLLLSDKGQES